MKKPFWIILIFCTYFVVSITLAMVISIKITVDDQSCICPVIEPTPTIDPTIEPEHHSRPDDNFETEWLELLTT